MLVGLISPWMIQSSQGNGSIDGLFNDTHCSKEHSSKLTNGGMIRFLLHCSGNGFHIYLQMNRIWIAFYSVGPPFFFQFTSPILRAVKYPPPPRPPTPLFRHFLISASPWASLCYRCIFSPLSYSRVKPRQISYIYAEIIFCLIFNCPSHNRHSFTLQLKLFVTLPNILSKFTYYFWLLSWPLICHSFSPFSAPKMLVFLRSSGVLRFIYFSSHRDSISDLSFILITYTHCQCVHTMGMSLTSSISYHCEIRPLTTDIILHTRFMDTHYASHNCTVPPAECY